jgi:hypothetical protein
MKKGQQPKPGKKPYAKPRLRTIRLSADEVLVTGCKQTPVSLGVDGNPCLSGACVSSTGT